SRLPALRSAAGLAQRILGHLHQGQQDGLEDLQFPPPRGYRAVRICALTGKRATHACGQVLLEWFRPGQEPLEDCDAHVLEPVDARGGLLASAATPRRFVEVRRFTVLPARYAAWAAAHGLPRAPAPRRCACASSERGGFRAAQRSIRRVTMGETETVLGPSAVFQAFLSYQKTEALRAAIDVDLFTAIGAGAGSLQEIAARCQA